MNTTAITRMRIGSSASALVDYATQTNSMFRIQRFLVRYNNHVTLNVIQGVVSSTCHVINALMFINLPHAVDHEFLHKVHYLPVPYTIIIDEREEKNAGLLREVIKKHVLKRIIIFVMQAVSTKVCETKSKRNRKGVANFLQHIDLTSSQLKMNLLPNAATNRHRFGVSFRVRLKASEIHHFHYFLIQFTFRYSTRYTPRP